MVSIRPDEHGATRPPEIFLFQILLLNRHNLIHARSVTSACEIGGQPNLYDLLGECDADQARAERQHIRIVMFPAVIRG